MAHTLCWLMVLLWTRALAITLEAEPYRLSPPAEAGVRGHLTLHTNLRELEDIRGLALLLDDQLAAERIEIARLQAANRFVAVLQNDPIVAEINTRLNELFRRSLSDKTQPRSEIMTGIIGLSPEKVRPTVQLWIQDLFRRRGVLLPGDLERLSAADQSDICQQVNAMKTLRGLPTWRYRMLGWRYRDAEVRRLNRERDERFRSITPVDIRPSDFDSSTREAISRYQTLLQNLKVQVVKNQALPYERFRTLEGLLRGLRYMDTIMAAAEITGVDAHLMTRLFIQESEFLQERVSGAGAFSIAQFMDVAVRDLWGSRKSIAGAVSLLGSIENQEALKAKIIADPRTAIRAAFLYFRHVRDTIVRRFENDEQPLDERLTTMMSVELYTLHQGLMRSAEQATLDYLDQVWPVEEVGLALSGGILIGPSSTLAGWIEQSVRMLVEQRLSEDVYRGRRDRLMSALGLAAYNSGTATLLRTGKRRGAFGGLGFPIQLTETRRYVDEILNGVAVLEGLEGIVASVTQLEYDDLVRLSDHACELAAQKKTNSDLQTQTSQSARSSLYLNAAQE